MTRTDIKADTLGGRGRAARRTASSARRRLEVVAAVFALAVIVHNADHLRRGADKLTAAVFWVGMAGIVAEVTIVLLVYARHRLAPAAAGLGGLVLAAGYLQVHFLPRNRFLSDSFIGAAHVSALSWFAAGFEIVAALALAAAGFAAVGAEGGWSSVARGEPAQPGRLWHPVPLMLAASQALSLAVAFAQAYS